MSYEATSVLLRNTGDGRFVNVSDLAGDGLQVKTVARGVACDDLDNDDLDATTLRHRGPGAADVGGRAPSVTSGRGVADPDADEGPVR
jgi:hypothetical protein